MRTFSIRNFGCRVNQAEAFDWAEAFEKGGFRFEDDWARSDLILVNSCSLTSRADRDVRKFVLKAGRENPRARLVVTGCYAQRAREELERIAQALLVVPNSGKKELPEKVLSLMGGAGQETDEQAGGILEAGTSFRSRALLKVQDGCDNACTFCIIPSLRGKSASVGLNEVLARARDLVDQGYREIVLAGIHLSSYGKDEKPEGSLLLLLREIGKIEGLGRVRLSSLDPRQTDRVLVEHVAANPKVCQHFHLSLQHASPHILKAMGRPVESELYPSLLEDLRRRSPEASLGADIIVGFPGETEEEFRLLEDFLAASPLTYFHVFPYSPRPGTPAAERPGVPDLVIRERAQALRRLSAEKNLRFRATFTGRILDAIVIQKNRSSFSAEIASGVEGVGASSVPSRAGRPAGIELLTSNYFKVLVPACTAPERERVRVLIDRVGPRFTEGVVETG
jgi:threonylcarbamoyladenosine tRNA methylthiotransferase MtaB